MTGIAAITQETIQNQIYTIRGKQVMMDRDLARMYSVETKALNQAVKRNLERFPDDFMFQLTKEELASLRSQFVTLEKKGSHSKYSPTVYTEHGVLMLASVLRSDVAIKVSVLIINAFVEMRRYFNNNMVMSARLDAMEKKQFKTDENVEKIFEALESKDMKPKQGIFYDGQVFDAYVFVADLIREARHSIVLIDNYVDDTVLSMFTKRVKGVSLTIYTKDISKQLSLDKKKHDQQYEPVTIKQFKNAHDRFLIIDGTQVYHIGASLKDLGNKWFAFSKMELSASEILKRLS
jgi:hypothetical protein